MIDSIKLTRFKQFRETEIRLRPFSILMGENNSGKTTVLQAIWLALAGLHQGKLLSVDWKTGQVRVSATGYHMYDVPFAPQGDFSGMFYNRISREGQTYDENSGAMIQLTDDRQNCFRLHLRELFRNLNFKLVTPAQELQNPDIQNYAPLYISGFAGLHFQEERMFPAVLEARIASGNTDSIVRNIVLDLKQHAPEKFRYLEKLLDEEFGFRIRELRFREDNERYVFSEYEERTREGAVSLEFGSCGSGIMHILQIVAVILRYCPEKTRVVLIDEPDAHLHGNLQIRFLNLLMKLQQELGIQMVLAAHSAAMIQNADPQDVIPVLAHASVNEGLAGNAKLHRMLEGRLDAYDLGKAKISGKLAFFEGPGLELYEKMAEVLHIDSFSGVNTIPAVCGWDRTDALPFRLQPLLHEALGREIEIHVIYSSDDAASGTDKIANNKADSKVIEHYLPRREIDRMLLDAGLICRTLNSDARNRGMAIPSVAEIQEKIDAMTRSMQGQQEKNDAVTGSMQGQQELSGHNVSRAVYREVLTWLSDELGLWISEKRILMNLYPEDICDEVKELLTSLKSDLTPYQAEETVRHMPARREAYEQLTLMDL